MDKYSKRQYILGGAVVIAVMFFIVLIYSFMQKTNLVDINMDPADDMEWSYEIISGSEARPAVPVSVDESTIAFPGESGRAVKAERVLKEELSGAQIGIFLYDAVCGAEIYLDDEPLYTSFEGAPRDAGGFAVTDGLGPSHNEKIQVFLPEDYLGRRLTVVTYFTEETSEIIPVFPYLCSSETLFALTSIENVAPLTHTAICALLAILTALVYLLDIKNGSADKKILLLTLFYIMLFANEAISSNAGTYSLLHEKLGILNIVCELRVAPLLIFAAFCLTSWRRWTLLGATGIWVVCDSVKIIRSNLLYGAFMGSVSAAAILLLCLLAALLIFAEFKISKKKRLKRSYIIYALVIAAAAVIRMFRASAKNGMSVHEYLAFLFMTPAQGNFYVLMQFVIFLIVITVTAVLIIEFVRRTLYSKVAIGVLEEQNRLAMNSYNRMAKSEEATYSLRHEMRHHMLAISGMLAGGETERARKYAAAVTSEYNDLPQGQYSKNTMVNIIAGEYLSRAKESGIKTEYSFSLPESVSMADTDLCVFLTNMFENALNACERIAADSERYISVKMYLSGNCLYIGCRNSARYEGEEIQSIKKSRIHGYGMENMKRIVEKYGGAMEVERGGSSFSIKSNFYLK